MAKKAYYDDLLKYTKSRFNLAEASKQQFLEKAVQDKQKYHGLLPEPIRVPTKTPGVFVQPLIQEVVKSIQPELMNVFSDNRKEAVKFRAQGGESKELIEAMNKEINNIIIRDNDGYEAFNRASLDAFITGVGAVQYGIEDVYSSRDVNLEGFTEAEVVELLGILAADLTEEEFDELDNSIESIQYENKKNPLTGEKVKVVVPDTVVSYRRKHTQPFIRHVNLDEWFSDEYAAKQEDQNYFCHIATHTVGDLLDLGHKRKDLEGATLYFNYADDDALELGMSDRLTGGSEGSEETYSLDPLMKRVTLYSHFIRTSIPTKGRRVGLYRVLATDKVILEVNEVEQIPFVLGNVEILSGSMYGISYADMFYRYQHRASVATELRNYAGMNSTFGRYKAVKGQYDKRSLLEYTPGGVVEENAPGMVDTFIENSLSPSIEQDYMAALDGIARGKMSISGSESGGMPSNISTQTMAMAIHSDNLRTKQPLRNWAQTFVLPLMEGLYNLLRTENWKMTVETDEGDTEVPFSVLPSRRKFIIDINTGLDDILEAQKAQALIQVVAAAPQLASVFPPEKFYGLIEAFLADTSIDASDIAQDPSEVPPPSPEEEAAMAEEQAMVKEQAQLSLELTKTNLKKATIETVKLEAEVEDSLKNSAVDRALKEHDAKLKEREVGVKEGELELKADKVAFEKVTESLTGQHAHLRTNTNL